MRRYTYDLHKEHYCSDKCRAELKPCQLCRLQRDKKTDDVALEEGRPTLTHNPFGALLKS